MQATLSAERLQYILEYSKRDDMVDDPVTVKDVTNTACAAMEYLQGAGIHDNGSFLYQLAVASLTTHWLDNRAAIQAGSVSQTPIGLRDVINQLKFSSYASVPDSGTGL